MIPSNCCSNWIRVSNNRYKFVSFVCYFKKNDKDFLEQRKSGFVRTLKWNKYRSKMAIQNNNSNLNYSIDPTYTNANWLFVLSFERIEENNVKKDHIDSFLHYYVPNVEIKDFHVLIGGKKIFDLPLKTEEEADEKIVSICRNNDCTTINLLDFDYFKENYRLIAIDLSKQIKLKDPQQINFIEKLENQAQGATCFLSSKNLNKLL